MLLSYFKSIFANLQYVNNGESHLMRPSIHYFVDVQTTDLEGWYDTIYYLKKPLVAPIGSSNTTFLLATHFNSILFSQNVCTNLDPDVIFRYYEIKFLKNKIFILEADCKQRTKRAVSFGKTVYAGKNIVPT